MSLIVPLSDMVRARKHQGAGTRVRISQPPLGAEIGRFDEPPGRPKHIAIGVAIGHLINETVGVGPFTEKVQPCTDRQSRVLVSRTAQSSRSSTSGTTPSRGLIR
jgi:hypothetical protein